MQAHFYRPFVEAWAAGAVNPVADPLYVQLLGPYYVFDEAHASLSDVAEHAVGEPRPLTVSVAGSALLAEPVAWPEFEPARGAVVFRDGGLPVAHYEFGRLEQGDGELRMEWDGGKLFDVRAAS